MVRLITSYYPDKSAERANELMECLHKNFANEAIDEIVLLTDYYERPVFKSKVKPVYIHERPTFDVFFNYAKADCWNIVANSDIYFDETVKLIEGRSKNEFLCLCRHDVLKDGRIEFLNRWDAQDAWLFYGKPKNIIAPFMQGIPGCDNSLAYRAETAGYKVTNPSLTIKCYHLHNSNVRTYTHQDKVAEPYKLITPHK